jgi:hypothetical protein
MTEDEWYGEPHTLIVHEVTLPDGPLDDGDLGDYDLEHPPSCKQAEKYGGHVLEHTCDVAHHETGSGLAYSLRWSGTPITEPGTYRIQGWGRKIWTECGDEYDGGVGLMDDEEATSA